MRYAVAVICLTTSLAQSAHAQDRFLTVTIADIGRPYTVVDGDCKFAVLQDDPSKIFSSVGYVEGAWEGTTDRAILNLVADAKKAGGNAIVGLRVSTVGSNGQTGGAVSVGLDGVMACGTIVKFKN